MPTLFAIEVNSKLGNGLHSNGSKLHCKRVLLFQRPKIVLPMSSVYWLDEISFENSILPGVHEC